MMKQDFKKDEKRLFIFLLLLPIIITAFLEIYIFVIENTDYYDEVGCIIKTVNSLFCKFEQNKMDIFLSQISTTFLTISVFALLGLRRELLYWEDLSEYIMKQPLSYKYTIIMCMMTLIGAFFGILRGRMVILVGYYLIDIFGLVWMIKKILTIYFDKNKIQEKLNCEYQKAVNKEEYLERLYKNTIILLRELELNEVRKNIDFYIREGQFTHVLKIMEHIPETEMEFFYDIYIKLKENENAILEIKQEILECLKNYLKTLIKRNTRNSIWKRELLKIFFEESYEEINSYMKDEMDRILYEAVTRHTYRRNGNWRPSKYLENKLKSFDKNIQLLIYAYSCLDYEVMDYIICEVEKLINLLYSLIEEKSEKEEYCDEIEWDAIDEFHIQILNEDEIKMIKNILKQEKRKPVLTIKQIKRLKDIAKIEEYEPSAEEDEIEFMMEQEGKEVRDINNGK